LFLRGRVYGGGGSSARAVERKTHKSVDRIFFIIGAGSGHLSVGESDFFGSGDHIAIIIDFRHHNTYDHGGCSLLFLVAIDHRRVLASGCVVISVAGGRIQGTIHRRGHGGFPTGRLQVGLTGSGEGGEIQTAILERNGLGSCSGGGGGRCCLNMDIQIILVLAGGVVADNAVMAIFNIIIVLFIQHPLGGGIGGGSIGIVRCHPNTGLKNGPKFVRLYLYGYLSVLYLDANLSGIHFLCCQQRATHFCHRWTALCVGVVVAVERVLGVGVVIVVVVVVIQTGMGIVQTIGFVVVVRLGFLISRKRVTVAVAIAVACSGCRRSQDLGASFQKGHFWGLLAPKTLVFSFYNRSAVAVTVVLERNKNRNRNGATATSGRTRSSELGGCRRSCLRLAGGSGRAANGEEAQKADLFENRSAV